MLWKSEPQKYCGHGRFETITSFCFVSWEYSNLNTVEYVSLFSSEYNVTAMSLESELEIRSKGMCELCSSTNELRSHIVVPKKGESKDEMVFVCSECSDQLDGTKEMNSNHWRCLTESMWSEVPAIKVIAWRMLNALRSEGWAVDLIHMMYLDEEILNWAESEELNESLDEMIHRDSNGAELNSGDSIVLIKDLNVKGANFVAKRGTAVRNITLVHDNPEQIEGRVNGQKIVILTQYVKK